MPSKTPGASDALEKPDSATVCPASGKKLRLKDCVQIHFTPVPAGEDGRYMDPVTKDTLTNASRLLVIVPTGDVVLEETYKACIKPEGEFRGKRVRDGKDTIRLQTGGSGFAGRDGEKLQTSKHFQLGPGSGRADLRGQHQGPRSAFGLRFQN